MIATPIFSKTSPKRRKRVRTLSRARTSPRTKNNRMLLLRRQQTIQLKQQSSRNNRKLTTRKSAFAIWSLPSVSLRHSSKKSEIANLKHQSTRFWMESEGPRPDWETFTCLMNNTVRQSMSIAVSSGRRNKGGTPIAVDPLPKFTSLLETASSMITSKAAKTWRFNSTSRPLPFSSIT